MTDRELLELAAKAAGIKVDWDVKLYRDDEPCAYRLTGTHDFWNPLEFDGDALRLAVQLDMDVDINICFCDVVWVNMDTSETFSHIEDWGAGDVTLKERMNYVRRAIVRAAAASDEPKCSCGDRAKSLCPGEWEPGCDLGANEKFARLRQGE
jgi:hypothetical protein